MLYHLLFGTFVSTHAIRTIVVGSGPGGTGFIKRALEYDDCDDTFEWLEEGGDDFMILDWPAEYTSPESTKHMKFINNTSSGLLKAIRFSGFGGGATRNSGGPLTLIPSSDERVQTALEKHGEDFLMEELQSLPISDPTSDEWIQRYTDAGYEKSPHFMTDRQFGQSKRVGYGATTFGNGTRTQVAKSLLNSDRVHLSLNTSVKRVIFGTNNNATGVELMNGTIVDGDRVILAAGVFGTYELLIRSGIGSKKDLTTIGIEPIVIDESVGKHIGDDVGILFLHKGGQWESNSASHGADIIAAHENDFSVTHWGKTAYDSLLLGTELRFENLWLNKFFRRVFEGTSIIKIDLPSTYSSSISMQDDGTILFDNNDKFQNERCVPNTEFDILKQSRRPPIFVYAAAFIFGIIYSTPDIKCSGGHLVSNFHYHGGTQGLTQSDFSVKDIHGLYISDASVTDGYSFGAPTTNIYMIGFAVADAIYGNKTVIN